MASSTQVMTAGILLTAAVVFAQTAGQFDRLPLLCAVGVLTVPRAHMRYEAVFARHDVSILVAPLTVAFVALFALTFGDARPMRFTVWGVV